MPGINDLQIKKLFQNLKCCDNDEDIKLFNHLIFAEQALGIRGLLIDGLRLQRRRQKKGMKSLKNFMDQQ